MHGNTLLQRVNTPYSLSFKVNYSIILAAIKKDMGGRHQFISTSIFEE
jgi:hypothetical protein